MDAVNIVAWEGRTQTRSGRVSTGLADQIHATLAPDAPRAPAAGDMLPPLWHWCAFPPTVPTAELGTDGHPHLGDFLPPIRMSRRMWAGGALSFHAPLRVDEELSCSSTIMRVDEKLGAENPMVFVTVNHEIRGARGVAVREQQTIVYLDIPPEFMPPKKRAMPDNPAANKRFEVREATLFRFSAITFNAHRIHYDLAYTQETEKYPGLVIHGPLQAMQLMQLATAQRGGTPSQFEFRGVHPMFLGDDLDLMAVEEDDGGLALFAGQAGHQGTFARALWEGTL